MPQTPNDVYPTYPDDLDTYWWVKIQGKWEIVRLAKWSDKRFIAHSTFIRASVILNKFEYEWGGRVIPPEGQYDGHHKHP